MVLGLSASGWNVLIAGFALLLSCFNLWYIFIRKGKAIFACSRWTAIGLTARDRAGLSIALQIGIVNHSTKPLLLKDLMLLVDAPDRKIFYDPIFLFDLTQYIASVEKNDRILKTQKGLVPLPINIPPNQQYDFPCELLFLPYDKKTAVLTHSDTPCTLNLYALTDRAKSYEQVATQKLTKEAVQELQSGGFSGVLSTASTEKRESFVRKLL